MPQTTLCNVWSHTPRAGIFRPCPELRARAGSGHDRSSRETGSASNAGGAGQSLINTRFAARGLNAAGF